jgi:hypothetical protein
MLQLETGETPVLLGVTIFAEIVTDNAGINVKTDSLPEAVSGNKAAVLENERYE